MTALHSRMRAVTLAALLVVSTLAIVAVPATVSAQISDEPNDTRANATAIGTNEFLEGTIDEAGGDADVDWYRFEVAAGDHLRVVSAEGYGVGSSYTLYGPGGEELGSGDEYGTENAPVAGERDAAGGTYYLEVTNDGAFAGESYGFSVETTPPDAFEPNEKQDEAVAIEPGEARSGVIAASDSDWFAVSVAAGETLDASVELTDTRSLGYIGDNNADLDIYDPSGNEVGENPENVATNNAPADQTSRFDGRFGVTQRTVADEGGTYYVRIAGVDTTGFSSYDLTTAVSTADGDDSSNGSDGTDGDDGRSENGSDENDSDGDDGSTPFENATVVDSPSAIGNGQIDADGNADVYAFEMREGSQVEIMQGVGGGAYPVTVLNEDGTVLGRIADQDVYRGEEDLLRANASGDGTYYLKIEGAPGDRYSILGSVTEPDANEPNDDRTTATAIATGGADRGTIVRGDTDYYAVQLDAGETIDVFANASARAALTVYGPSGSTIESAEVPSRFDGTSEGPTTTVTAEESGTYYLELSIQPNAIGQVGGEYAIELQSTGGTDDGQSGSGIPSDRATGDDGSNTEEPNSGESNADESNIDESDADGETPAESTAPAPIEQTTVETASGTTSADAGSDDGTGGADGATTQPTNEAETTGDEGATIGETTSVRTTEATPEGTNDGDAVTNTVGNTATEDDSGRADGATPGSDVTTADTSVNDDSEPTTDETEGTDGDGATADDSSTGDGAATDNSATTDAGTAGTAPSGGAEQTAVDGPGFGLLAALLAVLGVGAFALGRD